MYIYNSKVCEHESIVDSSKMHGLRTTFSLKSKYFNIIKLSIAKWLEDVT